MDINFVRYRRSSTPGHIRNTKSAMDPAMAIEVAALAKQKTLEETIAKGDSEIQQFYRDKTIFVTGGSGFLGKQLIEKLFRSTRLRKLFLLLRPKKGKSVQERLIEMLKDPVFEGLHKTNKNFGEKIVPVAGDIAELRLGMGEQDWKTVAEETEVIFHLAATTRFDEALRVATLINVRGTREILTLGHQCQRLKSLVHLSTAYAHATIERSEKSGAEVAEKFYPSPVPPHTLIDIAESLDPDRLDNIASSIIKGWPNTYSFAKAVAEELIRTDGSNLPICVVRPAIVIHSWSEPAPGWLDMSAVYGASGLVLGPGLGVTHVVLTDPAVRLGLVPVDMVNNATLAAAAAPPARPPPVYHVVTTPRNPHTWKQCREELHYNSNSLGTAAALWYICSLETRHKLPFLILSWLAHMLPAALIDGARVLVGKERKFMKLYSKMFKMNVALSYFILNNWKFIDKNTESLYNNMSHADKIIYNFDIPSLNWNEYLIYWIIGLRKYIIKDGLKDTDLAVKKQFWFRILHYIVTPLYICALWKIIVYALSTVCYVFSLFYYIWDA